MTWDDCFILNLWSCVSSHVYHQTYLPGLQACVGDRSVLYLVILEVTSLVNYRCLLTVKSSITFHLPFLLLFTSREDTVRKSDIVHDSWAIFSIWSTTYWLTNPSVTSPTTSRDFIGFSVISGRVMSFLLSPSLAGSLLGSSFHAKKIPAVRR